MLKLLFKAQSVLNSSSRLFLFKMQSVNASSALVVELKKINSVGHITLNRPKALNALNLEMVRLMQAQIDECERDDQVKMILVKGAGGTAFCAGGDVKYIRDNFLNGKPSSAFQFFRDEYVLDYTIANLKKPYVALLNGITMGGGVGISVHGKYRVATEKTLFAMPETAIGFFADVGGSYFLPRLADNLGLYLALTGQRLKGQDVKKTGLATHFVSAKNLENLENEFLQAKSLSPKSVEEILNKFNEPVAYDFDTSAIKRVFNVKFSLEEILANLERENTDWSRTQLKLLAKMSPMSLKVSIRQLELGAAKSLKECLEMEFMMCLRFAQNADFVEGVRAVLVDKCNQPKWKPSKPAEINAEQVEWYFKPLPDDEKFVLNSGSVKL